MDRLNSPKTDLPRFLPRLAVLSVMGCPQFGQDGERACVMCRPSDNDSGLLKAQFYDFLAGKGIINL